MRFISLSYVNTPEFKEPEAWIKRIRGYFGVLETLSRQHMVISIEQIDYEGQYLYNGVTSYFLKYGKQELRFPVRLHRFVRRLRPDIVIVHGLIFPLQVIQLRMALGRKVRIVLQGHADKPPRGWRKGLQRLADRCTDAYLFTSHVMAREWLERGLIRGEQKIRELMVTSSVLTRVSREEARQRTGCTGAPVFVWAGRLNKNKDPFTLVEAFSTFVKDCPQARLYMIYQTEELHSELQAWLAKNPLSGAMVLVGKVKHEDMVYWLSAADFVVSTSLAEAFGLAVVEAMSCGCIPIVSDIPSYRKITDEGRCGLLFEAGNVQALAKALQQGVSLDLREERRKVSQQFAENLSFQAIADRLGQIGSSL